MSCTGVVHSGEGSGDGVPAGERAGLHRLVHRLGEARVDFGYALAKVGKELGCAEEQVRAKGRKKNRAREMAIYIARGLSGKGCSELGAYFGGVSGALITMMANRVAKQEITDKALASSIQRVKNRIFNI